MNSRTYVSLNKACGVRWSQVSGALISLGLLGSTLSRPFSSLSPGQMSSPVEAKARQLPFYHTCGPGGMSHSGRRACHTFRTLHARLRCPHLYWPWAGALGLNLRVDRWTFTCATDSSGWPVPGMEAPDSSFLSLLFRVLSPVCTNTGPFWLLVAKERKDNEWFVCLLLSYFTSL